MTSPDVVDSVSALRKRWWDKYFTAQTKSDTKIRTVLVQGASDAEKRIAALATNSTFSAGVRTAQLRLAIAEANATIKTIFDGIQPIIQTGQGDAAQAAADGLSETDLRYLTAAFSSTNDAESFIKSQRVSAVLNVAHAISSVTKSDQTLSARVYKTRSLANNWVKRDVTIGIMRGDSAQTIAKTVRKHIRPDTPGGVSYAAMRLSRTELNNAFHATSIVMSQDRPWITGMQWYVSATHVADPTEPCSRLANQVFDVDNVPAKPHPQCRCFVAPQLETYGVFQSHLTAGYYRDWIQHAA